MSNVNTEDLLTAKQVASAVGIPLSAANAMLKGIEPELTAGNTRLWLREDVRTYLYGMHEQMLNFMGIRPPAESYDGNISFSAEPSATEV